MMEEATPGAGVVTVAGAAGATEAHSRQRHLSERIPGSGPSTSTGSRRGHSPALGCMAWFTAPDSSQKGIEAQPAFRAAARAKVVGVDPQRGYRLMLVPLRAP